MPLSRGIRFDNSHRSLGTSSAAAGSDAGPDTTRESPRPPPPIPASTASTLPVIIGVEDEWHRKLYRKGFGGEGLDNSAATPSLAVAPHLHVISTYALVVRQRNQCR